MGRLPGQGRPRAGVSLEELGHPPICGAAEHPSHQGTAPEPGPGLGGQAGLGAPAVLRVGVGGKGGPSEPFPLRPALPVLQTPSLGPAFSQEKKTYEPTFLI